MYVDIEIEFAFSYFYPQVTLGCIFAVVVGGISEFEIHFCAFQDVENSCGGVTSNHSEQSARLQEYFEVKIETDRTRKG